MARFMSGSMNPSTVWFRNLAAFIVHTLPLGTRSIPSAEREQVEELSLSLEVEMAQAGLLRALGGLQAHFGLARLVLWAPHLRLGDREQMVAVQVLSGAVIQMSLLTHLSLPGDLVTEYLLSHIALLPLLESFAVSSTPLINNLSGEESNGFGSLRFLDVPDANFLRRFSSYRHLDLETLKVRGLCQDSLSVIARNFFGLREVSIEGTGFNLSEIFVLGACFQLEEIEIFTQCSLGMENVDLRQFRAMFRNLRSLSIKIGDWYNDTNRRKDYAGASLLDLDTGSFLW